MNEHFQRFMQSGKIVDYLKYRTESTKTKDKDEEKNRDNNKLDGLSRKP